MKQVRQALGRWIQPKSAKSNSSGKPAPRVETLNERQLSQVSGGDGTTTPAAPTKGW